MKHFILALLLLSAAPAFAQPVIVGQDGQYLGKLSTNKYDPDSVSNPYGQYGSKYSPKSINNPYGQYGSKYSPYSANNPYASSPPLIVNPSSNMRGSGCYGAYCQ